MSHGKELEFCFYFHQKKTIQVETTLFAILIIREISLAFIVQTPILVVRAGFTVRLEVPMVATVQYRNGNTSLDLAFETILNGRLYAFNVNGEVIGSSQAATSYGGLIAANNSPVWDAIEGGKAWAMENKNGPVLERSGGILLIEGDIRSRFCKVVGAYVPDLHGSDHPMFLLRKAKLERKASDARELAERIEQELAEMAKRGG